jgi:DUF971 family protein
MNETKTPTGIKLHQQSKTMELIYSDDESYTLSCEYLRVYSPSAEVLGHAPGQEVLQFGKINVNIDKLEAVGNYAVKPTFSDGHDSGIYSWKYLYELATTFEEKWQDYLGRLTTKGKSRDPEVQVVRIGN